MLAGMPSSRTVARLVKPSRTMAQTTARSPISADTRTVAAWVRNGSQGSAFRHGAEVGLAPASTPAVISLPDSLVPQRGLDKDLDPVRLVGRGAIAVERPRKFTLPTSVDPPSPKSRHSSRVLAEARLSLSAADVRARYATGLPTRGTRMPSTDQSPTDSWRQGSSRLVLLLATWSLHVSVWSGPGVRG